ncbi:GGDEF domain-containing phosphodiesterase [Sphingorhabdus sp. Alg239-R122]|uniref:putative bifunctional diguanylate cyclase/phosphodiesterase n=1 Tax=Sphingorhabdus sp. Alg239-R122 TaxID=2305989 RepID=UPI0013DBC67A|nr:GGDEF domain-containing phosphodiesterase [Sphingorhabdus sp. Alg239-R122]
MSRLPDKEHTHQFRFLGLGKAVRLARPAIATTIDDVTYNYCAIIDLHKNADDAELLHGLKKVPHAILAIIDIENPASLAAAAGVCATHIIATPISEALLEAQMEAIKSFLDNKPISLRSSGNDHLTGLPDAYGAGEQLQTWLEDGKQDVFAIMCGLRRFETVNTAFGPNSGDMLLETIAQRIRAFVDETIGKNALVARFGGRDFLIAAQGPITRRQWQFIAAELLELVSQPVVLEGQVIRLTARASLAKVAPSENAQSYIGRLVSALKQAQRGSVQNIKWADRAADGIPEHGYQLESDLMRAIDNDQIKISFQPQFSVKDGRIVGAEALARWEHHEFGKIGAAVLFALAERTDFTEHLSTHIGMLAMQQAAKWPETMTNLRLSLNVTAEELASPRYMETLREALELSGFDAGRLTLEITESALIGNLDGAAELLSGLRELDVKIAIDDFGTGYSNFLYLKSLPLDYIKLDHAMTGDIAGSVRDRIIVRSIIALAQSLELEVIAEGVETEEQLTALQGEGCQYYQGFLRARALAPEDFENFVLSEQ